MRLSCEPIHLTRRG